MPKHAAILYKANFGAKYIRLGLWGITLGYEA
jgi:hypothetical protein